MSEHGANPGPSLIPVDDAEDPRLEVYRDQKDAWLRARHNPDAGEGATPTGLEAGLFMAESELVVRELIESAYTPESVLISETRLDSMREALTSLPASVPVYVATRELMRSLAGFDIHRGVLAAARRGPNRDAAQLARDSGVIVVMEDLANHDNVGGIMRSLGVLVDPARHGTPAALLSPRCCDPLYRKALRVSIGQALRVPFATIGAWPEGLSLMREAGVRTIGLSPSREAAPLREIRMEPGDRIALLVGAEGPGLSPEAMGAADQLARIEQRPGADSLNVVVAASVALATLLGSA